MPVPLRLGSRGIEAAVLQVRLNMWGVPGADLVIDGLFGPFTHAAVIAFQRKAHLAPDGIVGPKISAQGGHG